MSNLLSRLFNAPIFGERIAECECPREAIDQTMDFLGTATVYADGKRIRERDARATLKLLERL